MLGQHRARRTPEVERRVRRIQAIAVVIVLLITLALVYKAIATV